RQAACQTFGECEDVGLSPGLLIREPLPTAADAGLDFVSYVQAAGAVADPPHCVEVIGGRKHDPGLALSRFNEDGGAFAADGFLESLHISVRHEMDVDAVGPEGIPDRRFTGQRQSAEGTTVETVLCGHEIT